MATMPSPEQIGLAPIQPAMSVASPRQESRMQAMFMTMPGQAEEQAGAQLHGLANEYQQEQNNLDKIQVEDAVNQLKSQAIDLAHGDDGYMNKKGSDATKTNLLGDYTQKLNDVANNISTSLQNPQQQQLFKQHADAMAASQKLGILGHLAQQSEIQSQQVTKSGIDVETQDAFLHSTDPAYIEGNKARISGLIDARAKFMGLNPDNKDDAQTIADMKMKAVSPLNAEVISSAIEQGNTNYAQEYLKQFKTQMEPNDVLRLENALKSTDKQNQAMAYSDNLFSTVQGYSAQMKQVQQDFAAGKIDGQQRQAIEARVDHNRAVQENLQNEYEKKSLGNAYDWLNNNPGKGPDDMPPSLYQANLNHLPSLRNFAIQEGKIITDPTIYVGLHQMAANEPQKFANLNLLASRDKLSDSNWQELVKLQSSINKSDAKVMAQEKSYGMAVKSVTADMEAAGLHINPKNPTQAEELAKFQASVYQAVDQQQSILGRPLTFDEARKVGLDQLKQGSIQGTGMLGFFKTKERQYQLKPGQTFEMPSYQDYDKINSGTQYRDPQGNVRIKK